LQMQVQKFKSRRFLEGGFFGGKCKCSGVLAPPTRARTNLFAEKS